MATWRPPSSNARSQTPLRLHTPQAIRPPSRVLLDEPQQHGWPGAAPSPPLSSAGHADLFSDTESLFSATSTRSARKKRRKKSASASSPAAQLVRFVSKESPKLVTPGILLFAILIKSIVGLGGFSGKGKPPLFGDLEAQRHWLSLVWHQPWDEWYFFDLQYWGLDYPPLTAYHSVLLARVFHMLGGDEVIALRQVSEVADEDTVKTWMRLSVLWTEAFIWIPGVLLWSRTAKSAKTRPLAALTMLLQPALILIDNGHFQYNSVMLGFTLVAQTCFHWEYDLLGAACFVLSLCYKQMALYYAPAIFAYLFGKCWARKDANLFFSIAFVTITSFALCFAPFLASFEQLAQAIHRIFPFARGLFEDKVANVWCALNVVYKLRQLFTIPTLTKIALGSTLLAILPGMLILLSRPRKELLPFALANSSLAFFLFSFQVHEKSILLPLMPLTAILATSDHGSEDHSWTSFINNVAVFSMWPLLKKDGLQLQFAVLPFMWNYLLGISPYTYQGFVRYLSITTYAAIALFGAAETLMPAPARYPDLYPVLNVAICAPIFGLAYCWTLKRLAQEAWAMSVLSRTKVTAAPEYPGLPNRDRLGTPNSLTPDTPAFPVGFDKSRRKSSLASEVTSADGLRWRG